MKSMNTQIQQHFKIAILMGLFPEETYDFIIEKSNGVIQYAADALQKSLLKGFIENLNNKDLHLINLPYVGSYPVLFSNPFMPQHDINFNNQYIGENIPFINIKGYKNFSRFYQTKKALSKWCEHNKYDKKIIIVYAVHTPFLSACISIKKKYKDVKIIQVVPDLPQFMASKSNILRSINNKFLERKYKNVDGWVLLSEQMTEMLPTKNNYTVVEGIYSDNITSIKKHNNETFKLFYAGTLARRYGIMNLVKAVCQSNNNNIELNICGDGDSREEIEALQKIDKRIVYKGQLPRVEVLKLLHTSDLLVNPRTPEGEFTKYSFPSKTMEYLASGVPTLLYKLPGIPCEYYEHCFTLEELGIEKLSSKIEEIYNIEKDTREQIGINAKRFILEKKNPKVQVEKIISLIQSL